VGKGVGVSPGSDVARGALVCVGDNVSVARAGGLVGTAGEEQEIRIKMQKVESRIRDESRECMGCILTDMEFFPHH